MGLDHLSLLEREVESMTAAIGSADPEAPVTACPGWSVRDLVGHVIGVHTWVTATLGNDKPGDYAEPPQTGSAPELAERYHKAGSGLVQKLHELPPETPTWSFDDSNRTAGYWQRRQLHEISVHRWDVAPYELDPAVAADGMDEAIHFFVPRFVGSGRATLPEGSLVLESPERTWTLGAGEPRALAQGSSADLLLSMWGRKDLVPQVWRDAKLMP